MRIVYPFLLGFLSILLSGCWFSSSQEIKRAEKLVKLFECYHIESQYMMNSPLITYHQQLLGSSKQKALDYLERYQNGEQLFELPLDQIIQQQYELYVTACEHLGGLPLEKISH